MSNKNTEIQDLDAIIQSVSALVDSLVSTENTARLNKAEESSKEASKEEKSKKEGSSKESSKKEESMAKADDVESSGHENQAPEVDGQPEMSQDPSMDENQDPSQEQGENLESMVQTLDDDMLQELKQVVDMELNARQSQGQQPDQGQPPMGEEQAPAAPAPEMPGPEQAAMKSEVASLSDKLAKSEATAQKLEKAFLEMTNMVQKLVSKPVQKAVTDIKSVDYVDKGEKQLKKSESDMTDSEVMAKAHAISADPKKLSNLTKNERGTLMDYLTSKKRTQEIVNLINK